MHLYHPACYVKLCATFINVIYGRGRSVRGGTKYKRLACQMCKSSHLSQKLEASNLCRFFSTLAMKIYIVLENRSIAFMCRIFVFFFFSYCMSVCCGPLEMHLTEVTFAYWRQEFCNSNSCH
jgi:hypothetical protein